MINDEELLMQAATMPMVYFDGLGAFRKINGVLRCVGYVIGSGAKLNLILSLAGAELANRETRRVLDEEQSQRLSVWGGSSIAH
jgi:hypothetical protein